MQRGQLADPAARNRQAPGFRKSTLRRTRRRKKTEADRPKQLQSERLYEVFKCDMKAADYALKAAAMIVVAGALSGGAYSVLKSASSFVHVLFPIAGYAGIAALLWVACQLLFAFALSLDKSGRLRRATHLVQVVAAIFIAAVIGQLFPLFVMIWTAGL